MASLQSDQASTSDQGPQQQITTISFPYAPEATLHISLTTLRTSYLIFLTSRASGGFSLHTGGLQHPALAQIPVNEQSNSASSTLMDTSLLDNGVGTLGNGVPSAVATMQDQFQMGTSALGSFVYGFPNRFSPSEPLTTTLVGIPANLEVAIRICKILIRKLGNIGLGKPVYLGCSIVFDGFADAVQQEIEVTKAIVEEIVRLVQQGQANGINDKKG